MQLHIIERLTSLRSLNLLSLFPFTPSFAWRQFRNSRSAWAAGSRSARQAWSSWPARTGAYAAWTARQTRGSWPTRTRATWCAGARAVAAARISRRMSSSLGEVHRFAAPDLSSQQARGQCRDLASVPWVHDRPAVVHPVSDRAVCVPLGHGRRGREAVQGSRRPCGSFQAAAGLRASPGAFPLLEVSSSLRGLLPGLLDLCARFLHFLVVPPPSRCRDAVRPERARVACRGRGPSAAALRAADPYGPERSPARRPVQARRLPTRSPGQGASDARPCCSHDHRHSPL